MKDLAELTISARQVGRIAHVLGEQLQAQRDHQVEQVRARTLQPRVETHPGLAVVEVDGGRLQVRGAGDGPGAHDASWSEDKIAMLATAASNPSDADPEPDVPDCYRNREYVEQLVRGISGMGPMSPSDPPAENAGDSAVTAPEPKVELRPKPELLVRTYVATTGSSEQIGPMVAAALRGVRTAVSGFRDEPV